ncbi:tetratricopeptide repeat protein [Mesorhizobium sp. M0145]|uniref:tetratricopeptide repeat protein n=1 Tax=unclassified Mesorhizobium TaxID=325217 RepID=UPI003339E96B
MQPAKARSRVATLHGGTLLRDRLHPLANEGSVSSAPNAQLAAILKMRHRCNAAPSLAYIGERKKARSWLARALAIDPDDFVTQYNAACMYSVLGEVEEAVRYLERAVGGSVSQNVLERIRHEVISTPFAITRGSCSFLVHLACDAQLYLHKLRPA